MSYFNCVERIEAEVLGEMSGRCDLHKQSAARNVAKEGREDRLRAKRGRVWLAAETNMGRKLKIWLRQLKSGRGSANLGRVDFVHSTQHLQAEIVRERGGEGRKVGKCRKRKHVLRF